jgi:hypothetical protein
MPARPNGLAILSTTGPSQPFLGGLDHLHAELEWLRLLLHREVLRLKAAHLLSSDPFRGLYLADEQVDSILCEWSAHEQREPVPEIETLCEHAATLRSEIDMRLGECGANGSATPLMWLAAMFDLTDFECRVLIAALAVEVDLRFEILYSWARNDLTQKAPSVDLVLKLFCDEEEEQLRRRAAFRMDGTLFRNHLMRIGDAQTPHDTPLPGRSLRIDERIAGFLLGQEGVDQRLASFTTLTVPVRTYSSLCLPEHLRIQLWNAAQVRDGSIFCLCGPDGSGRRSTVEALCSELQRPLLRVDLSRAVDSDLAPPTMLSLLQREALLCGADLLLEHAEAMMPEGPSEAPFAIAMRRMLPLDRVQIYVASEHRWNAGNSAAGVWRVFDFPVPSFLNRVKLWELALSVHGIATDTDLDLESLAGRYALTGGAIHRACEDAVRNMEIGVTGMSMLSICSLESAARGQSSHGLRRFAQKVDVRAGWESLVVPRHILRQLRDVCTAERYRQTVYGKWGFDQRLTSGKGLNVLFCGSSGTGKTMAAGIVARELGLDLYRIDLSIVVSKYIGETEKQLSLIFREAKTSNAALFFDEADALFGKRSEVKDAHDRYANIEVAYLLQKMEEYEGIVILATNLRRNMDDAFSRRLQHVIEFPFPDAEHRERIWRSILPPAAPVAPDIDFAFLGRQFELSGGNIRNVALASAFYAAEEGTPIRMEHCVMATALEMQKTGKLPSRAEFRDYYDLIRTRI